MIMRAADYADHEAIHAIVTAAFEQEDEANLVDQLRDDGDALVELVAEDDTGEIVGHIFFSPLAIIRAHDQLKAAALAPLAVKPGVQKSGIGGTLMRAGIEACRAAGVPAIIVLGHPSYYPRFGFTAEAAAPLSAPFSGPSFMALELQPGILRDGGIVRYAPAFGV